MHVVLKYHQKDIGPLPNEDQVMTAVRAANLSPGVYMFPHAPTPKDAQTPAMVEKFTKGPVGLLTALRNGPPVMTTNLVQWFVFTLLVGVFVAYVTSRTVASGAEYMGVFRLSATIAFLGYAGAEAQQAIWRGQPWSVTVRNYADGLVYALLTAGFFAWLWPR